MKLTKSTYLGVVISIAYVLFSVCGREAYGFDFTGQDSSQNNIPIVIEADGGLTCDQKENWCEAHGNATATRGDQTIKANKLRAYFEDSSDKKTASINSQSVGEAALGKGVKRLVAEGKVEILSPKVHGWSDYGEYVAKSGCVKLTGQEIRLESGQEELSSQEEIQYCQPPGSEKAYASARGNAKARKQGRLIQADTLKAYFKDKKTSDQEESSLEKAEAFGKVKIVTLEHIAQANRGEYVSSSEDIKLWGKVKITRGQNQLNGEYGYMNVKSGHAEILANDPAGTGSKVKKRVRALITPSKKNGPQTTIISPSSQDLSE